MGFIKFLWREHADPIGTFLAIVVLVMGWITFLWFLLINPIFILGLIVGIAIIGISLWFRNQWNKYRIQRDRN
jgi:hypothetical protein